MCCSFLSVYVLPSSHDFICQKILTKYLRKQIKKLDTFYARHNTLYWLPCVQATWFKRILFLVIPTCQKGKMWIEFFLDLSSWWDRILTMKVNEHQTSQSSHVNGAIAFVEVNLIALSSLLFYPSWNFDKRFVLVKSFVLVK